MATIVQVNLRAPEGDKAVLADVAARLREGGGFAERLSAFLAADGAGAAWSSRLEEIERRLEALEVQAPQVGAIESKQDDGCKPAGFRPVSKGERRNEGGIGADPVEGGGQTDIEDLPSPVLDDPVAPAGAAVEGEDADWTAKAAAITTTTGEGKGRKLTEAGAALFADMLAAGVSLPSIARAIGISNQSAHTRARKLGPGG